MSKGYDSGDDERPEGSTVADAWESRVSGGAGGGAGGRRDSTDGSKSLSSVAEEARKATEAAAKARAKATRLRKKADALRKKVDSSEATQDEADLAEDEAKDAELAANLAEAAASSLNAEAEHLARAEEKAAAGANRKGGKASRFVKRQTETGAYNASTAAQAARLANILRDEHDETPSVERLLYILNGLYFILSKIPSLNKETAEALGKMKAAIDKIATRQTEAKAAIKAGGGMEDYLKNKKEEAEKAEEAWEGLFEEAWDAYEAVWTLLESSAGELADDDDAPEEGGAAAPEGGAAAPEGGVAAPEGLLQIWSAVFVDGATLPAPQGEAGPVRTLRSLVEGRVVGFNQLRLGGFPQAEIELTGPLASWLRAVHDALVELAQTRPDNALSAHIDTLARQPPMPDSLRAQLEAARLAHGRAKQALEKRGEEQAATASKMSAEMLDPTGVGEQSSALKEAIEAAERDVATAAQEVRQLKAALARVQTESDSFRDSVARVAYRMREEMGNFGVSAPETVVLLRRLQELAGEDGFVVRDAKDLAKKAKTYRQSAPDGEQIELRVMNLHADILRKHTNNRCAVLLLEGSEELRVAVLKGMAEDRRVMVHQVMVGQFERMNPRSRAVALSRQSTAFAVDVLRAMPDDRRVETLLHASQELRAAMPEAHQAMVDACRAMPDDLRAVVLSQQPPAFAAEVLATMDREKRLATLAKVSVEKCAEVLRAMSPELRDAILTAITDANRLAAIVAILDPPQSAEQQLTEQDAEEIAEEAAAAVVAEKAAKEAAKVAAARVAEEEGLYGGATKEMKNAAKKAARAATEAAVESAKVAAKERLGRAGATESRIREKAEKAAYETVFKAAKAAAEAELDRVAKKEAKKAKKAKKEKEAKAERAARGGGAGGGADDTDSDNDA